MKYGFVKVAAATPIIRVSDCKKNTDAIIAQIKEANIEAFRLLSGRLFTTVRQLFLRVNYSLLCQRQIFRIIQNFTRQDIIQAEKIRILKLSMQVGKLF